MIPARFAHLTFSFFLSGMMSFIITGVATLRAIGLSADIFHLWLTAWPVSWMIAFPAVTVVAPIARALSNLVLRAPD
jgi:Protein of unknown function (DUF2798)